MKKIIALMMCTIVALGMMGCTKANAKDDQIFENETVVNEAGMELANPMVKVESLKEAEEKAGFSISLPETMPEGYEITSIYVFVESEKMIQVTYANGSEEIIIRKAASEGAVDGYYHTFAYVSEMAKGDKMITLKGNNDKTQVATWSEKDYYYSIGVQSVENDTLGGLSEESMLEIIDQIS